MRFQDRKSSSEVTIADSDSCRRTNCDLSGCTRPDRSRVELSRFAGDAAMRFPLLADCGSRYFSGSRELATRGGTGEAAAGCTACAAKSCPEPRKNRPRCRAVAWRMIPDPRGKTARKAGRGSSYAIRRAGFDTNPGNPSGWRDRTGHTRTGNRGRRGPFSSSHVAPGRHIPSGFGNTDRTA